MEHPGIYAGVDTHSDTHTLALIDEYGRPLATQTFTADPTGYERLVAMIGDPDACLGIGVEGTNSYGAALTRRLVKAGYNVYEVLRPKRSVRRRDGKSDPIDALAAARSVLAGDGTSVPKSTDGWVEALRARNPSLIPNRGRRRGWMRHAMYLFNGLCAGLSRVCWPCYR